MSAITMNPNEQVYNVREDPALSSRVALVVCGLLPRGLYMAGFSITKELLTIHYSGYSSNRPVWDLDFFEQAFNNEPLLAVREKIKGIFIGGDRTLVVPEELYSAKDATTWLRQVHFVEKQDVTLATALENDKARYLYAVPLNISELIRINFRKASVYPLSMYHFGERQVQSLQLQCCVAPGQAYLTLHNYSQLLWHRVIDVSCAEDIAFEIKALCRENYIDAGKLNLACNGVSATEFDVVNELSMYFPALKSGVGHTIHAGWDPAISLANQLFQCVL